MAKLKTQQRYHLAVLVQPPKADFDYTDIQTYKLGIVTVDTESNNRVRNISSSSYGEDAWTKPYADLQFRAQGPVKGTGDVYGWTVSYYDLYNVDLPEAERIMKMLKRISNLKMPVQPATFGQYVQLIAQGIGITKTVTLRGKRPGGGWSHDDCEYSIRGIQDCQWEVDRMVAEFVEPYRKTAAQEATNAA
jgi:hypothetical protein